MQSVRNNRKSGQIVTTYEHIFREKLEKLEQRGQGHSNEAEKIRKSLALIDSSRARSGPENNDRPLLVAVG